MILYHYTNPAAALLIGLGDDGLKPGLGLRGDEHADQTIGVPVVWPTKQESNAGGDADGRTKNQSWPNDIRRANPVRD